jgi:hypothetical protein
MGSCTAFKWQFRDLVKKCNWIRKDKGLKIRFRWRPYQFFQDEGVEEPVIEFLRITGIGYKVASDVGLAASS